MQVLNKNFHRESNELLVFARDLNHQRDRESMKRCKLPLGGSQFLRNWRIQATSSKFQAPSSKEAPSSKLKNRPARRLPRHLFLGFGVLRFGPSLELGVWCLVFRSAVAQKLGAPFADRQDDRAPKLASVKPQHLY